MASQQASVTFRVRQIPAHSVQFHDVTRLLHYILQYHKPASAITVHSLASSIDCFEQPSTKVATVTFEERPAALGDDKRTEWIFPSSKTSLSHNIIIDTHFRGFTVLNEVHPERHLLDCIAVSGLAGHAFGSWRSRDVQNDFMWLRDSIPRVFSRTRVLIYGYDAQLLESESFQTIRNISLAFVAKLRSVGLATHSAKPLLFIAHSLGGIVVKQALVQIANSPDLERTLLAKVKRVIFFGVPNRGMQISHLLPMVKHRPNEPLIQALCKESPYLAQLDEQFFGISLTREMDLVSVYETHKSQIPQKTTDGQWKRAGPFEILVEPTSAIQRGTKESDQYPINKDHSNLVKFAENEDALGPILHFIRPLYDRLRELDSKEATSQQDFVLENVRTNAPTPDRTQILQNTPAARENAIAKAEAQRKEMLKSILESINAEETNYRYRAVESAYHSTFHWVSKPELGLVDWIKNGTGIFWINGKPGSGKSTAMKHIYENLLELTGSSSASLSNFRDVTAKFFFFQRGSSIQKSLEGLLRSILFQILSTTEELAELLLPSWLKRNAAFGQEWSPIYLDSAWAQILEQKLLQLRITLFLDALDEYEGPADKAARFVENAANQPSSSMTQVRICFASRPWDVFSDRFSKCPGFRMETHTRSDVESYVRGKMQSHEAMRMLLNSSEATERASARRLVSRILDQARGVFIWVKLVLENLLDARTEGAELEELDKIITSLPDELEDLYAALLARVKVQGYHREAYAMLELLVRAPRLLTLHEFRCIVKCATQRDLKGCVDALRNTSPQMSEADIDAFRRRIKSRCGGLVEVIRRPPAYKRYKFSWIVQLMHQTVKDFVARPGFKSVLDLPNDPISSENGHSFLAKFGLAMIQGAPSSTVQHAPNQIPWLSSNLRRNLFALCTDAFHYAELTTGFSQNQLLDTIPDRQFVAFFPQGRYDSDVDAMMDYAPRKWPIESRLSFAVIVGLPIYLENSLQGSSAILKDQRSRILHNVVERMHYDKDVVKNHVDLTEMIHTLLDHGADVHERYEGLTPFQALFRCNDPTPGLLSGRITEPMGHVAEIFLEHGSDPNTDVFYLGDNIESFQEDTASYTSKPLHVAVGCPTMVQLLLDFGANVNDLLETAGILVRNGGKITHQSLEMVEYDEDVAEDEEAETDDEAVEEEDEEEEEETDDEAVEKGDDEEETDDEAVEKEDDEEETDDEAVEKEDDEEETDDEAVEKDDEESGSSKRSKLWFLLGIWRGIRSITQSSNFVDSTFDLNECKAVSNFEFTSPRMRRRNAPQMSATPRLTEHNIVRRLNELGATLIGLGTLNKSL